MGRVPICTCGYVKLWHGVVQSSENSQHLTDWYTPSHVIHGFGFYALTWLIGRRLPFAARLLMATTLEASWEVIENTDFVINRYREATIALDYYGDSILNSVCDILAFVAGYAAAASIPIWVSVASLVAAEALLIVWIRDSLLLNVLMLIHPIESVKAWQRGG
jgi:uncharacterized protein DUF2585